MKKHLTPTLFCAALLVSATTRTAQAQVPTLPPQRTLIGDNPTADADIQTVHSYLNALLAGDTDKAKLLLADTYRGYGPGAADSTTRDQEMAKWQQAAKRQLNPKVALWGQTSFLVKVGPLRGTWVATWGTYTCTQAGKTIQVPFNVMDHITKGKIDMERSFSDDLAPLLALGYKLTPPAPAATPVTK